MGNVIILEETTRNPISLMGQRAGVCWGADITNRERNYKRGLDCLESGHGRVIEYVNVEMVLDGYSARVIREWYTHVGGSPSRLQASTRYINYAEFAYVVPGSVKRNEAAMEKYTEVMKTIQEGCRYLTQECDIPREDAALMLPIGMETKIVDKRNLRNLIDMSHQRLCSRANWEYRGMMNDIVKALSSLSEEWAYVTEHYFMPKCEMLGYCPEKHSCGRVKKKES